VAVQIVPAVVGALADFVDRLSNASPKVDPETLIGPIMFVGLATRDGRY
jgi:hypothetical protein